MGKFLVIIILLVVIYFAARSTRKHIKGDGGCCGGGASKVKSPKKKLVGQVIARKRLEVKGMHCDNCKARVEAALDNMDGVIAKVNLGDGTVEIEMDREIAEKDLMGAIKEAGYQPGTWL